MSGNSFSYFDDVLLDGSCSSNSETPEGFQIVRSKTRWRSSRQQEERKGSSKRFRPRRCRACHQSPPHKKIMFESLSPTTGQIPQESFFLTDPAKTVQHRRYPFWQKKKPQDSCFIVKAKEMKTFFKLTDDDVIRQFLNHDTCNRVADKYLLAMVFAYFKRADLSMWEYTRFNFFIALYLANDVEEDEEEIKYEIFPWALGKMWKEKHPSFLKKRDRLLRQIDYKAIVSRRCSDEIMAIEPDHPLWKRERPIHHAGALRSYMRDPEDDGYPRGPDRSPRYCHQCDSARDSQYDSASPASISWCISSDSSSPEGEAAKLPASSRTKVVVSRADFSRSTFDMKENATNKRSVFKYGGVINRYSLDTEQDHVNELKSYAYTVATVMIKACVDVDRNYAVIEMSVDM